MTEITKPPKKPTKTEERIAVVLRLEKEDYALLQEVANARERSMQWILRKVVSAGLLQMAKDMDLR